jgi:hypothetical protein
MAFVVTKAFSADLYRYRFYTSVPGSVALLRVQVSSVRTGEGRSRRQGVLGDAESEGSGGKGPGRSRGCRSQANRSARTAGDPTRLCNGEGKPG